MKWLFLSLSLLPLLSWGDAEQRLRDAEALTQRYPLVDGHIDVPYLQYDNWQDLSVPAEKRDFDLPRARAGGLDLAFMSIYLPASSEADGTAYATANRLIDGVEAMVMRHPDSFALVTRSNELAAEREAGKISFALGMENGAPIAGKLENLDHFYRRGVRYITLTHSLSNHISDSSYDKIRLWDGLSPFGLQVVARMNALGMIIDVSHLSDAALEDVLEHSRAPVVATHSSMRKFTPDFERNISDELLSKLAAKDGVVMINFGSSFLTKEANAYYAAYAEARDAYTARHKLSGDDPRVEQFEKDYRAKRPFPFATVSDVADHIDHVRKRVGIEHIGLGSDYDGVGDSLPTGLKDVSQYPNLVAELLRRRYSEEDIAAILGGNFLRVWAQIEDLKGT